MADSIHDLVTAAAVSKRSGVAVASVEAILAAQRRLAAICRSANAVVILPLVTLSHRGDELAKWCRDVAPEPSAPELARVAERVEREGGAYGTFLCEELGCPPELLGSREVWLLEDLLETIPVVPGVPDDLSDDAIDSVVEAFWSLAEDALPWVWPYDRVAMERAIEDWLVDNLHQLEAHGLKVRLAEPSPGVTGRQWRSSDGSARLDLLLEVMEDGVTEGVRDGESAPLHFTRGDLVVVELKAVPLRGDDIKQVERYVGHVEREVAAGRHVWGLLIGPGADASLYQAMDKTSADLLYLWVSQVGYLQSILPPPI